MALPPPDPFPGGHDVSCRLVRVLLEAAEREGLGAAALAAAAGLPGEHLRDPHAWISWERFCVILDRLAESWDDEALRVRGHEVAASRWLHPLMLPARLLYSADEFYQWIAHREGGLGGMLVRSIDAEAWFPVPERCTLDVRMRPGYTPHPAFFTILEGALAHVSALLGLPRAEVASEPHPLGRRYTIDLPRGGGALAWVRRLLAWPAQARAAARALQQAYVDLHARHRELQREVAQRHRAEHALVASRARTSQLLDTALDGFILADPEGLIHEVNPAYCELIGRARADIVGRHISEFEAALDEELVRERIETMMRQRRLRFDTRHRAADGSEIDLDVSVNVIESDDGPLVAAFVRDISARKAAEAARRESEYQLRLALSAAHMGTWQWDLVAGEIWWSPELAALHGLEPEARRLTPGEVLAFMHPEDRERLGERMHGAATAVGAAASEIGEHWVDYRVVRVDGVMRWLRSIGNATLVGSRIASLRGVTFDVTAEREAEAEKRRAEERQHTLWEHLPDAIAEVEADGTVCVANRAMAGEAAPARGQPIYSFYPERHRERLKAALATACREGRPILCDIDVRTDDGVSLALAAGAMPHADAAVVWWAHRIVPLGSAGAGRVLVVASDVTDRKRAEDAVSQHARRLEVLQTIERGILHHAGDPTALAQAVVDALPELAVCERVCVLRFDADQDAAHVLACAEGDHDDSPAGARIPLGDLGYPDSFWRGAHMQADGGGGAAFRERLQVSGWRCQLAFPLMVQDEVIGALELAGVEEQGCRGAHLQTLRQVAAELALGLHSAILFEEVSNARQRLADLSRRLVQLQERERRTVALELHDEMGQLLTALRFALDTDGLALDAALHDKLAHADELIERLADRIRNLSLDLRPPMLDDMGLLTTLQWYLRRYHAQTGIEVTLRHAGLAERRLPAELETTAFRIVQEALTNVARHASASAAVVRAWSAAGNLYIQIEDRGRGFRVDEADEHATGGLSGIRERAALVDGRVSVDTAPGSGTQIEVILPLHDAPDPPA